MSLPIRYSPIAFYFRLSIVFLTPQILRHLLHWRDLLQPSCKPSRSLPTIPYTHHTIGPVPRRRPSIWPMDHIVTFSFLSLFSFIRRILLWPDRSQVITPCSQDLTIHFTTHEPCARFTYCLYLRLLYLLQKRRKFSSELRLKFISSHHFTSLHLRTFTLSCTPNTLRLTALYWTSISHHFALLDTMSGDHFTAPELHPSEPHRIYT